MCMPTGVVDKVNEHVPGAKDVEAVVEQRVLHEQYQYVFHCKDSQHHCVLIEFLQCYSSTTTA